LLVAVEQWSAYWTGDQVVVDSNPGR